MHMVTRQQIREGKLCEHLSSFVVKASIMRAIIRGRGDDCGAIFCSCCRIAFTFDEISINIHAWNMAAQVGAYFPNAALPCKNEFGYSVKINVHIGLRRNKTGNNAKHLSIKVLSGYLTHAQRTRRACLNSLRLRALLTWLKRHLATPPRSLRATQQHSRARKKFLVVSSYSRETINQLRRWFSPRESSQLRPRCSPRPPF